MSKSQSVFDAYEQVVDMLRDVADSGAADYDPRLSYVEVQVHAPTWERICAWREADLRTGTTL